MIQAMRKRFDVDGDGQLDLKEFNAYIKDQMNVQVAVKEDDFAIQEQPDEEDSKDNIAEAAI